MMTHIEIHSPSLKRREGKDLKALHLPISVGINRKPSWNEVERCPEAHS